MLKVRSIENQVARKMVEIRCPTDFLTGILRLRGFSITRDDVRSALDGKTKLSQEQADTILAMLEELRELRDHHLNFPFSFDDPTEILPLLERRKAAKQIFESFQKETATHV
jgi:hypothetical protein